MKKLLALHFKFLPFLAHYDFFERLSALLASAVEALKTAIAALMPAFNTALANEEAVADWVRKSVLTEKIAEADAEDDRILVGINAIVQTGLHSSMSAIHESAVKVHVLLSEYGRVTRKSYDEEAGAIRNMLVHFTGDYAADVANLGMAMWVQQLQTAFNTFESLLAQRNAEQGEKPPFTARDVRKAIEEVYHQIEYVINANAAAGATPAPFAAFIDLLNPDIERLNAEFHRALKDISAPGATTIPPIPVQQFTEKPVTPLPAKVLYTENKGEDTVKPTVELFLGKDYTVTYKNNIDVGMATLIVHGKGDYKGQVTLRFNIARQPFPVESGELKVEN